MADIARRRYEKSMGRPWISPGQLRQWHGGEVIVHLDLNRAPWWFLCSGLSGDAVNMSTFMALHMHARVCHHCMVAYERGAER